MDWALKIAFDHNDEIKVNDSKLIDFVIRILLTRTILMPRFSNLLRNSIIRCGMFLNLETCFLRVTVSLLCQLQAVSKIRIPICPYLIIEWSPNCLNFVTGTATDPWLSGNMLPDIKEFLRKFENRGIKIDPVNWILIIKSMNLQLFTLILFGVRGPLWCWSASLLTASAQYINREVYVLVNLKILWVMKIIKC